MIVVKIGGKIMFNNVYPREKYLKKIRPFYDSDIIKVIIGIRRCGKSFILKAIMNELIDRGIPKTQIIYIPLDRRGYKNIKTSEELETKIESMLGDDENYYLLGYDSESEKIKHYRVDKMLHIKLSEERREGKECFKNLDMAAYAKKSFRMFGGKETSVKMLVHNHLAGVIIDRFGKDVMMIPADKEHFTVNVNVYVSRQFFGWVFSLGSDIKIVGPDEVVDQMKTEAERLMEQYAGVSRRGE